MAKKNGYSERIMNILNRKIKQNIQGVNENGRENIQQKKRVTVSYTGPYIRTLANIFKNTNIQITYKPVSKLENYLTSGQKLPKDIKNSGIYELICQTCKHSYIGQTSRDHHTRYKEHIRYIKNNDPKSAYAQHILDNQHKYGQIHNTVTLIEACNTRNEILQWENLYIQKYSTEGRLIHEQIPHDHNIFFTLSRTGNNADRGNKLDTVHDKQSVPPQAWETTTSKVQCTNLR